MSFKDFDFAEFINSPRMKREWDNLSNGVRHRRQQEDEAVHVNAQVLMVDRNGNVSAMESYND